MISHFRFSRAELLWATGSLATGSVYNAMALFSLFYMTQILGIGPGIAGTLLLITKIYDAVTDPIMGALSDRTSHRWGPRRPYLLLGAILLGLSFAAFFNAPELSGTTLVGLTVVLLLLQSTGYTVFAVPYLAMAPDIAQEYDARTRLMSIRVIFLILGVMLGSVLGPIIVDLGDTPRLGYAALGSALGALVVICGLAAFFGTRGVTSVELSTDRGSILAGSLRDAIAVFSFQPFRLLTIIKLLQLAVLALMLACFPYFFQFVLQRPPADIGKYLLFFSVSGLISIPAWRLMIGRFGKRNVYMTSLVGYAVGLLSWWLWQPGEPEFLFYLRAIILGILSNGTLLCALSLLPDTMEYDRLKSRTNREGVMSGVFTTVEKISGALGPFVIGILLQSMGLIAGVESAQEQPASAITAIHLGVSVVPALFCLACLPFLYRYRLDRVTLTRMRDSAPLAAA